MSNLSGLLKVRVIRGRNLIVRDTNSSDPYVVVSLAKQKVKTSVIKRDLNPCWDEELTLAIPDQSQLPALRFQVMDKDKWSRDDSLGYAAMDLQHIITAAKTHDGRYEEDEVIGSVQAGPITGLVKESKILLTKVGVKQALHFKLRDVVSGELEVELHWISL